MAGGGGRSKQESSKGLDGASCCRTEIGGEVDGGGHDGGVATEMRMGFVLHD